MKIVHLHSDRKFLQITDVFRGSDVENLIIVLGKSNLDIGLDKSDLFFEHPAKSIKSIVEICNKADMVVLYGLDPVKGKIALSLSEKIKVIWRFFGFELYSQIRESCLSPASISASQDAPLSATARISRSFADLKNRILGGYGSKDLVADAMKRIDFFMGLSIEEYKYLETFWKDLPEFIQQPFKKNPQPEFESHKEDKKPIILVGNNRSVYNNHLDIIEIISRAEQRDDYDFKLLFNYGKEDHYTAGVIREAQRLSCIEIVGEFLPKADFKALYNRAHALVINGYRQMAFANIRYSFRSGVKVYLNTKNSIYRWLLEENFIVFSMEDFEADLKTGKVILSIDEMKHNFHQWEQLSEKYSIEAFQKRISEILKSED